MMLSNRTVDNNEIDIDVFSPNMREFQQHRETTNEFLENLLCDYWKWLPNWINRPINLKWFHKICANWFKMFNIEDYFEVK